MKKTFRLVLEYTDVTEDSCSGVFSGSDVRMVAKAGMALGINQIDIFINGQPLSPWLLKNSDKTDPEPGV